MDCRGWRFSLGSGGHCCPALIHVPRARPLNALVLEVVAQVLNHDVALAAGDALGVDAKHKRRRRLLDGHAAWW